MATNRYFSQKVTSEQRLYEDIVIESLKMYGQDVYYIPREIVNEDTILNEDPASRYGTAYKVEMYIENTEGFEGEGDLFTKFGVEIRDEATFIISRKRFIHTAGQYDNDIAGERPREGDLIYLPLSKSLFEINHVENEQPFYQISSIPTFKCRAALFEYSGEDLDTGVIDIDNIEVDNTYQYVIFYTKPETATASALIDSNGVVSSISLVNGGDGYKETFPNITFSSPNSGTTATGTAQVSGGKVTTLTLSSGGTGYTTAPTISIETPASVEFERGETVEQTLASGVKVTGELVKQVDSDAALYITHVGANDGKFHTFVKDIDVTGGTSFAVSTVKSVSELMNQSDTEDNSDFDDFTSNIIDFSENNPFGDPE